jgi:hypothetical protein
LLQPFSFSGQAFCFRGTRWRPSPLFPCVQSSVASPTRLFIDALRSLYLPATSLQTSADGFISHYVLVQPTARPRLTFRCPLVKLQRWCRFVPSKMSAASVSMRV